MTHSEQIQPTTVFTILTERFNISELQTLCFNLNVDYENLAGFTKNDKARELVQYCVRHDRFPDLLTNISDLRPDAISLQSAIAEIASLPERRKPQQARATVKNNAKSATFDFHVNDKVIFQINAGEEKSFELAPRLYAMKVDFDYMAIGTRYDRHYSGKSDFLMIELEENGIYELECGLVNEVGILGMLLGMADPTNKQRLYLRRKS